MKTLILLLILSFLPIGSFAQEQNYLAEMLASNNAIEQKEGTTDLLKEYLKPYGADTKELFAILFSPQASPRLETDISYVLNNISKVKPDAEVVIIAVYPEAEQARTYVKDKFGTDKIITDTDNTHEKIFHYRAGRLAVTFLLQIDIQEGRLMCGGETPNLNLDFLKQFCNNTSYMPFASSETNNTKQNIGKSHRKPKGTYPSVFIREDKGFTVSLPLETPEWQGNTFLYADQLLSKGVILNIGNDTAELKQFIVPTETQQKAFVQLADSTYNQMKREGMVFCMANCVAFVPNTKKAVASYSLPNLFWENNDRIAYYNKPVLLETTEQTDSCGMYAFDFEHDSIPLYMYTHASDFIPLDERHLFTGCRKGFPTTCDTSQIRGNIHQDIFVPEFYKDTPFCSIFDKYTGKRVARFGHLDEIFQKTRTGYYFTCPIADIYKGKIVYTDGCSGKLWIRSKDEKEQEVKVFDVKIPSAVCREAESRKYTYDYFTPFFNVFHQYIEMLKVDNDGIHCLIRNGRSAEKHPADAYIYQLLDFNGETLQRITVEYEKGDEVLAVGLGKDYRNRVFPYYMAKNNHHHYLKYLR